MLDSNFFGFHQALGMTGRKLDLGDSGGLGSGLVTAMTLEVSVKHFVLV